MRILVLLAVCAGAGWYWFTGNRISEKDVHAHYRAQMHAFAERDAAALCDAYDNAFSGSETMVSVAGRVEQTTDKAAACEGIEQFFAQAKALESQMPGGFQIDTQENIGDITLSSDRKQATVEVSSVVKLGNPRMLMMKFTSERTDTFARRDGRLRLIAQESHTRVE